jgi:outer membrane protein OmpA-like peptidoglycan-associated protein
MTQREIPPAPPPPAPPVNGLCGDSNGAAMMIAPIENLCAAGTTTAVSGNGPWNWNCLGMNGGMTVSCTSLLQPPSPITGVCGAASGVPTLTAPTGGLCAAGISSAVSGKGPWTWSCSGVNGGGAVACVAPLAGESTGALPSLVSPSEMPAPHAASRAPVSSSGLVTPQLPSGPLPALAKGKTSVPAEAFPPAPAPSHEPEAPQIDSNNTAAPPAAPELPADATPVAPPPASDAIASSAAPEPPAIKPDADIPGNHLVLDSSVSTIAFTHGSENLTNEAAGVLERLADVLTTYPKARITLSSYADSTDSTPRDARRLSLSRALTARDFLATKGIANSRVDIRALGANVPSGNADRVDVTVN